MPNTQLVYACSCLTSFCISSGCLPAALASPGQLPFIMAIQAMVVAPVRSQLRAKYGLRAAPSGLGDYVVHCCCNRCAICEEARIIKAERTREMRGGPAM